MPLGAARLSFFHQAEVVAEAEVIRKKLSVSANNSAQVDTAQSKFGGASLLTNRTNPDYLSVQNDANSLDMGSGDWTVEFFMRPTSLPGGGAYHFIYDSRITGAGSQISIGLTNSKVFFFTTNAFRITGATTLSLNTMYHVAVVKSGSTTTLYLDGTSDGTYSDSNTYDARDDVRIGANFNAANGFTGNIDEFRVSNSARYTNDFEIPTTQFVNDDNTKLLLHMNGTDASTYFEDDNGSIGRQPISPSALGNAQVSTTQAKFGDSSGLFDGTGDAVLLNTPILPATDDWTVEMWVYPTSIGALDYFFAQYSGGSSGRTTMYMNASGQVGLFINGGPSFTSTGTLSSSTWQHIAWVRNGSSFKIYIDGTEDGSGTGSPSVQQIDSVLGAQDSSGTDGFIGYIDEVRISSTARYTAAFTAPTFQFKDDANTRVLLHMDGANGATAFTDDANSRSSVGIIANGNAQIDTGGSKFGGSSLLLDGTGDYLDVPSGLAIAGSGEDFTIEAWVYFNSLTGGQGIFTDRPPTSSGYTSPNFYVEKNSSNTIFCGFSGGGDITGTSSVSASQWYHMAFVRSSGTTSFYLDGTQTGSTLSYTGAVGDGSFSMGAVVGQYLNGYMDEIRVSNVARYTEDFTPSTTAFTNDNNTLFLCHCNGTDGDTDFRDDNGHHTLGRNAKGLFAVNDTQISTTQAKFGRSSGYWDGTGDYLVLQGSQGSDFSGDFTIECWYYPTSVSSNDKIFDLRGINSAHAYGGTGTFSTSNSLLIDNNSSDFRVFVDGSDRSSASSGTFTVNTWHHVCVQRQGGTINAWVDGTRYVDYAGADDYTAVFEANQAIGANVETASNVSNLQGYMDEMRISTVARYTNGATITVPTERFTDDANTHVLCHFEGDNSSTAFVDDVGGRSAIGVHAINGAQVSTAQSEFGGTSLDTTGASSGDYLNVSDDVIYLGDGDYTIEGRVRIENLSSFNGVFQLTPNSSTGLSGTYTGGIAFQLRTSTGNWRYIANATWQEASSGGPVASTWYHFALVRSGTTATLYIDGTSIKTSTDSTDYSSPMYAAIGGIVSTSNTNDGYIDEFRISNTARYTSGFTPATEPFQNDANTLLLLHMDGTNGSTVFTDDNGKHS